MKLLFIHDTYYTRKDREVYAHGAFPASLWVERYQPHFSDITVMGRDKAGVVEGLPKSSAEGVKFILAENINHPCKRIFAAAPVKHMIREQIDKVDVLIIRGPSELGLIAANYARKTGKPYAVELSGCGFDNLWYHGSLIAKLYAPLKYVRVRKMTKKAVGVLYVTQGFLQNRYPTRGFQENASNVDIITQKRTAPKNAKFIIGLMGNYNNKLKGLDVAIKALGLIKKKLPDLELRILGMGDPQKWQVLIKAQGLEGHVIFDSALRYPKDVMDWLDRLDLYIQPSRHEGLPRSLIEAMSRGLPALASDVGGIPELLEPAYLHRRGDYKRLAGQIIDMMDAKKRDAAGKQNFETSKDYAQSALKPRHDAFYKRLKKAL